MFAIAGGIILTVGLIFIAPLLLALGVGLVFLVLLTVPIAYLLVAFGMPLEYALPVAVVCVFALGKICTANDTRRRAANPASISQDPTRRRSLGYDS